MKKKFAFLAVAIIFSVLFFACKEEAIPLPIPPPLPYAQTDDSTLPKNEVADNADAPKTAAAHSKEKSAPKSAPKKGLKPVPVPCSMPCDTDSEQLSSGRYTVQIAIFPNESSAKALVKKMAGDGIKAYYTQINNPAQLLGLYYRVRVGFFNGRVEAESFAKTRLEPLGYAWWVDKRKNDKGGTSISKTPDDELEAAKRAYKEQIARGGAAASPQR